MTAHGMAPALLDELFPFNVVVSTELVIVSAGPAVARVRPEITHTPRLSDEFETIRPGGMMTYEDLASSATRTYQLRHRHLDLLFRGQFTPMGGGTNLVYLAMPWVTQIEQLSRVGLTMADFPAHASIPDLLIALQTQRRATQELEATAQTLRREHKALELTQDALARTEQRSRAVLEASLDGVVSMDTRGNVVDFNPAAERMFGYTADEIVGMKLCDTLIPPRLREAHRHGLARHLRTGKSAVLGQRVELDALRRDGVEFPVELEIVRVGSDDALFTGVIRDITDRKKAEQALRSRERLYRAVVESVSEVIFRTDRTGRVTFVNPSWSRMTSLDASNVLGHRLPDLVHDDDRHRVEQQLERMTSTFSTCRMSCRLRTHQGHKWVDLDISFVDPEEGPVSDGLIGTINDVTQHMEAERALKAAKASAEEASRAKSEFLATVSHEMRTPLNAVLGMLELARQTDNEYERDEYIARVHSNAITLHDLINDMIELSNVADQTLELDQQETSIDDLIEAAVDAVSHICVEKQIDLICDVASDAPDSITCDPRRLRQVLINLLGNAAKFTDQGWIQVTVRTAPIRAGQVQLLVGVSDSGPGIREQDLPHVFDRFYQAHGHRRSARTGGTGLGLAIARSLVELMGGRLSATSQLAQGSCFEFDIPVGVVASRCLPQSRGTVDIRVSHPRFEAALRGMVLRAGFSLDPQSANPDVIITDTVRPRGGRIVELLPFGNNPQQGTQVRKPWTPRSVRAALNLATRSESSRVIDRAEDTKEFHAHVLVADDHDDNRRLSERFLGRMGWSVTAASDGHEAVEAAARSQYDLILMDLDMPHMNGFEATAKIRAAEAHDGRPRVPIVAVTAHALAGTEQTCLSQGMDGYIAKPFSGPKLIAAAMRWVDRRPRILVADDNEDATFLYRAMAAKIEDYRFVYVPDGPSVLRQHTETSYAMILLDFRMPYLSGDEVARRLRAQGFKGRIIMLTNSCDQRMREECARAGCDEVRPKPINRNEFLALLRKDTVTPTPVVANSRPRTRRGEGKTSEVVYVSEDIADLIEGFLAHRRNDLEVLRKLIVDGQPGQARRVGHNMKGSGAGYGFEGISRLGQLIESAAKLEDLPALKAAVDQLDVYLRDVRVVI